MSSKPEPIAATVGSSSSSSISGNCHLKINNNTLTKEEQDDFLRLLLPACQPQEGSPANTFTRNELDTLQKAVGNIEIKNGGSSSSCSRSFSGTAATAKTKTPCTSKNSSSNKSSNSNNNNNKVDIRYMQQAFSPPELLPEAPQSQSQSGDNENEQNVTTFMACPQDSGGCDDSVDDVAANAVVVDEEKANRIVDLDWYGAPRGLNQAHHDNNISRQFRDQVRRGKFEAPTNGVCPGYLQCNLVVIPQGPVAFDFLLFCQRNPKACPLIEVCDVGSATPFGVAPSADLRTDVPRYAIYRDGKLDQEVTDVTGCWPKDSVAFLIGCSFSYDGELMNAGIPLKSASQGKNVPMYRTNLKCRPAGCLRGNMVVSMKPIPALQVSKHIEITSKYIHAHGGPVAVGSASAIGIENIHEPEWGESIDIANDEVPVFHACGVTPQSILMDSKVPFAITHSPGYMFVTDLPSTMGV